MKNIDNEFYAFQTKIHQKRNFDLEAHCQNESKRILKVLKKEISIIRNKKLNALDVACGYGNLLYLYKTNDIQAIGYDLDTSQVNLANRLGLNAKYGNIFDINFYNNKFGVISCFDFLEHIDKNEAMKLLGKFHSLLEKEGYLFIRMPCGDSPFGLRDFSDDPTHKWVASQNCIKSILMIAGFKNIKTYEDWPLPKKIALPRILIAKFLRAILKVFLICSQMSPAKILSSSMIIRAQK
jgi:2-polyprenyl-3-methyl-5-hydroxy-6-metoxy-1,4-benzoquinol methylase